MCSRETLARATTRAVVLVTLCIALSSGGAARSLAAPPAGLDRDADGIGDAIDNCVMQPNPGQRDTDGDGIGNVCDADFDGDCVVGPGDGVRFAAAYGTRDGDAGWDAEADLNGDGLVGAADWRVVLGSFGSRPLAEVFGYEEGWGLPSEVDQRALLQEMGEESYRKAR